MHQLCAICLGAEQLWVAHAGDTIDAAVITRVLTWDTGKKSLYVPIIGGRKMKEWLPVAKETLVKHAKQYGLIDIRGEFREGWARAAGFKVTGVNLKLEIE